MELNQKLVNMADDYYGNIAVNDFSSFIISDFKNDVLIDLSPERADENVRRSVAFIDDVKAMMETPLGPDDLAIAKSLIDFADYIKSSSENYWYKFNATHQTCPLKYVIKRLETFPMESESDKARYHRLFAQLPKVVNGMRQKLARQLEMGLGIYSEELDISKRMFASYIQGGNSLLNPDNRGIGITPAMAGDLSKIIADLNTELDGLIRDLDGFGAEGFKSIGATKGGEAYYGSLIKTYTSYNMTPQEIHQIGLRELEVTSGKMRDLIRQMGYNMSQEEFNRTVLTDRRFFDDTTEQLGARFARCLEKIRPKLPTVFKHLPKADCITVTPSGSAPTFSKRAMLFHLGDDTVAAPQGPDLAVIVPIDAGLNVENRGLDIEHVVVHGIGEGAGPVQVDGEAALRGRNPDGVALSRAVEATHLLHEGAVPLDRCGWCGRIRDGLPARDQQHGQVGDGGHRHLGGVAQHHHAHAGLVAESHVGGDARHIAAVLDHGQIGQRLDHQAEAVGLIELAGYAGAGHPPDAGAAEQAHAIH